VQAQEDRSPAPAGGGSIAEYFKFAERGTTLATELRAGLTTFMVMSYIIFVNPDILSAAGVPRDGAAAATALVAGVLSIAMGLVANAPIALAAGLGLNGVVAFQLAGAGSGPLSWQGAMGVVVLEGLIVLLLVVVGLREAIMNAVPMSLKRAIGVGIGLFILFIGFYNAGLIGIPASQAVPVEFRFPTGGAPVVALIGLLITVALFARRVPGALILSILITTAIALVTGVASFPSNLSVVPTFSTLGQFNLTEVFDPAKFALLSALLVIFTLMLADFFDTMGTATAISEQAGLVDQKGRVENIGRILLVDSIGAAAGGAAGVSSNTSYIESAAGVAEGGRTGLTAVTTGVLFLGAILLSPLALVVPSAATAPVLIVVGYLMVTLLKDIDFGDIEEGFPALLGFILMPLTFSITNGIGAAFIAYVVIKVLRGKFADVHPLMWIVALAFVVYFAQAWLNSVI
jgi:AGZA family xanthine/uracil permease-like MFS transporter